MRKIVLVKVSEILVKNRVIKPDNDAVHQWQVNFLLVYKKHSGSLKIWKVYNAGTVRK